LLGNKFQIDGHIGQSYLAIPRYTVIRNKQGILWLGEQHSFYQESVSVVQNGWCPISDWFCCSSALQNFCSHHYGTTA